MTEDGQSLVTSRCKDTHADEASLSLHEASLSISLSLSVSLCFHLRRHLLWLSTLKKSVTEGANYLPFNDASFGKVFVIEESKHKATKLFSFNKMSAYQSL